MPTITADGSTDLALFPGRIYTIAAGGDFGGGTLAANLLLDDDTAVPITGFPLIAPANIAFPASATRLRLTLSGSTDPAISYAVSPSAGSTPESIGAEPAGSALKAEANAISYYLTDVNNSQPYSLQKFNASTAPIRIARMGDSLMALGPVQLSPLMGTVGQFGINMSAGTAVTDFANWVTGLVTRIDAGQTAEFGCGDTAYTPLRGSLFTCYYIKESGAGTFDLEYEINNSGTWTKFTVATNGTDGTVNASNATTAAGIFTATLPTTNSPSYTVRVTNVSGGSVKFIMGGIYYNQGAGVINFTTACFAKGGVDFPSPLSTPDAILLPILADMGLDLVLSCWADAGSNWDAGGDFDLFYDKFISQHEQTDFVVLSAHPTDPVGLDDQIADIEKQRQWAIRNKQSFLNMLAPFKYDGQWMMDIGLKADIVHLNTAGGMVRNAHVWKSLTIGNVNLGSYGAENYDNTVYPLFTLAGNDSSPADGDYYCNRKIIFLGNGIGIADNADPRKFSSGAALTCTGGEFTLTANSSSHFVTGVSSFSGVHPTANGRAFGGRGSFFWNVNASGFRAAYNPQTDNYTITSIDHTVDVTANSPTITLPAANALNASTGNYSNANAGAQGKIYVIRNSGAGTVTLATTSSQLIDGASPGTLAAGAKVTLQSTGSGWITI